MNILMGLWVKHSITHPYRVESAQLLVEFYSHFAECQVDYFLDIVLDSN